jgi:hypothetical protein
MHQCPKQKVHAPECRFTAGEGVGYDFINDRALVTGTIVGSGVALLVEGIRASPWPANAVCSPIG